jgi:hypothetical protein
MIKKFLTMHHKRGKNKYSPIFFLLLFFLFSFSAEGKDKTQSAQHECLACHSAESRCEERLRINEIKFFVSVHGHLKCTDCHKEALEKIKGEIPHRKNLPDVNCTANCHREDQKSISGQSPLCYPDSVHGRAYLERGVQDVAKCWDCHTKHNIKRKSDLESSINRKNIALTCSICHEDMNVVMKYNIHCDEPYQDYMQSVHGKALFKDGLLFFAAVCTDCHGIHNIKGVGEPYLMAKRPATCGKCHVLVFEEYKESIHGKEALKGNINVPLCVDCHGEHKIISPLNKDAPTSSKNVSDTCSTCHARHEIMKKYGVPEDRTETFIKSFHGIASGYGYAAVANCTNCHGFHDIRPASDPLSRVNPANLAKTCGQENCHPRMPERISNVKIHRDTDQKTSGAPYYIQQILVWVLFAVIIITIIWFVPGFIRKIKLLKRKK